MRSLRAQIIIILILGFILLGLLIGGRFGFLWAGGEGYTANLDLRVTDLVGDVQVDRDAKVRELEDDGEVIRGEIIITKADSRVRFIVSGVSLILDERTVVEIIRSDAEKLELQLVKGRIAVDNRASETKVIIRSSEVRADIAGEGRASFVNYDFLRTFSIIPFDSRVAYIVDSSIIFTEGAVDILEVAPFTETKFDFQVAGSAAESFYNWIGWN